ncbi:MAG: hypothetical protein KDA65_08755 [Planctomycetaceae bacterium]|nr:hypothetical protein [Planctomycetaceae bacterium]
MVPSALVTTEFRQLARWMAPILWGFTLLVLILIAVRCSQGWRPEVLTGLILFGTVLTLNLFAGWMHRLSHDEWSLERELFNSGCTLFPIALTGFFTITASSPVSVLFILLGIVLAGGCQIFLAGTQEEDSSVASLNSAATPDTPDALLTSEPLASSTSNAETSGEADELKESSPTLEAVINEEITRIDEQIADVSLIDEPVDKIPSDSDTRIIDIPEEINRLPESSQEVEESIPTHQKNGHPEEFGCTETDRSYDLFAEQSEWVVQEFRRTRRPSGCEAIEGYMKVDWQPGQKRQMVHVPFYPPFAGTPEIYCEQADESDVRLKVAETRRYGTRIELCLAHPAEAGETTCLHFLACLACEEEVEEDIMEEAELISQAEASQNQDEEQGAA